MDKVIINFGCGFDKVKGAINVDINPKVEPDVVHDLTAFPYPFKNEYADEVYLSHVMEHIKRIFHSRIYRECWRILKPGGLLVVSYPEFENVSRNFLTNFKGQRDFWEACIFGNQSDQWNFHVCAMHTCRELQILKLCGFSLKEKTFERFDNCNTILKLTKVVQPPSTKDLLKKEVFGE